MLDWQYKVSILYDLYIVCLDKPIVLPFNMFNNTYACIKHIVTISLTI